jgi:hypothetical protein
VVAVDDGSSRRLVGTESQEESGVPSDEVGTARTSAEADTVAVDRDTEIVEENDRE